MNRGEAKRVKGRLSKGTVHRDRCIRLGSRRAGRVEGFDQGCCKMFVHQGGTCFQKLKIVRVQNAYP
jgi:hypothetical protein